jgi:rod shape-determining protein MreC
MGKALFAEEPDSGYRLLLAAVFAALLVFVDTRLDWLQPVRSGLAFFTEPVITLADLPRQAVVAIDDELTLRSTLADDNARLRQENLILKRHVQRLASLTAENARLRELLDSSALLDSSVLVAEIIGFDPDPSRVEVVINKGADAGLFVGQPVLDASGILGQLINVGRAQSRVILVTDRRHGVPIEISRNGVRGILVGGGRGGILNLQYMPVSADIREGDALVSSGLGGVFPRGYPVATVSKIERQPGETFMSVEAQPAAAVGRSRQVLVLFIERNSVPASASQPDAAGADVPPVAGATP